MRELKFRAWDGKRIRYDVTGFEHGSLNEMRGVFLDGDYYAISESSDRQDGDSAVRAVVMQFTGLHDRNGVEIYEGDIVFNKYGNELVKFETKDFGSCGCCYEQFVGSGFKAEGVVLGDKCEVIGNIYQNLELLDA